MRQHTSPFITLSMMNTIKLKTYHEYILNMPNNLKTRFVETRNILSYIAT